VTGLAWTEVGGDLLTIETACVPGKGKLTYTGSLGEVMQESIQAALTVVRSRADKLGINADFLRKTRYSRSRTGRGDAERWSKRGYCHVYRAGLLSDGQPGTR
jgi:ATP-dependent Lon protease